MLIHHACLHGSDLFGEEILKVILRAYPAGATSADKDGALPIHW